MNLPGKRLRTALLVFVVLSVFMVYVLQLMQVQIVEGETYKARLEQGTPIEQTVEAARGEILDRYGNPLAINMTGYNVVLDKAFLPSDRQNQIIWDLTRLLQEAGEEWIDNLPITTTQPFQFLEDDPQGESTYYARRVEQLKEHVGVAPYASVEDVFYVLVDRYGLEDFTPEQQRTIAGIRYEMERRGFNLQVPYTVAENISISTVSMIKERGFALQGVDVAESTIRQYVSGDTAPHIIGYIGPIYQEEYQQLKERDPSYQLNDLVGKSGIESQFESVLRGKDGLRTLMMNSSGDVIDIVEEVEPVPGNTVVLTLDSKLQQTALGALERQIKNLQETAPEGEGKEADSGAVVAIDCKTGEILVAATYPSYDMDTYRNNYSSLSSDPRLPLFNRALDGTYAPGSCFKPSVALAGLNEGLITPTTTITCGRVYTRFQDYHPTCLSAHGAITVMDALRYSCNIFFYELGWQLGIEKMDDYAAQLGLGQPTGIEIHEEIGELSSPETKEKYSNELWSDGDVVQSAIGQLYHRFTPLQLANYAATIANRGERMEAHIVKSIEGYNLDKTISVTEPKVAQKVDASEEAFESVIEGMVRASRIGTSSQWFGDYPLDVASKTGTPETHAYPNSTFIAFAPAEDPQIAVAVVIEKGWHGYTGAPVAKEIFNQYFFSDTQEAQVEGYEQLLP